MLDSPAHTAARKKFRGSEEKPDIMSSSPGTHMVEEKVGHPAGYFLTATHLPPCPLPHPGSPTRIQKARERERKGRGKKPSWGCSPQ